MAHMGWYVGVRRDGRAKNGRRTAHPWGQKAVRARPRQCDVLVLHR